MRLVLFGFYAFSVVYQLAFVVLNQHQRQEQLPENVQDVYDHDEYQRWICYESEKDKSTVVHNLLSFVFMIIMMFSPFYQWLSDCFPQQVLINSILMMIVIVVIEELSETMISAYQTFFIEEKYNMNTMSIKTFLSDSFKSIILDIVLLSILFVFIDAFYTLFSYIGFIVLLVILIVIVYWLQRHPLIMMRLFQHFEPLEEGSLRQQLTTLVEKYGFSLKNIYVMDASKRTKRANAFCCGEGIDKEICLDDNMLEQYSEKEILAVFCHEFGHAYGCHSEKLKWQTYLQGAILYLLFVFVMVNPKIYVCFGIYHMNYLMVFLVVTWIMGPIGFLLNMMTSAYSRRCEFEADRFAVKEGYGYEMINVLKKLSQNGLSNINPHPIVVQLSYSHPTLSQRIDAIEKEML